MKDIDNSKNQNRLKNTNKKKGEAKFKRTVLPLENKSKKSVPKKKSVPNKKQVKFTKKSTMPKRIISKTPAKRTVYLKEKVKKKLKKKRLKQEKPKTSVNKKVQLNGSNILSTLMGELLINTLVHESNKQLKRERWKPKEETIDNSEEEYDSEDDSDYLPESELEDFPSDVDYTEEEQEYINKLSKDEKDDLMIREFLLKDSRKKEVPIRFKILNLESISLNNKLNIIDKLDNFYNLDPSDNEYHKLSTWVDWLEKVPLMSPKICL